MNEEDVVSPETTKADPFQAAGLIPAGTISQPQEAASASSVFETEGLIPAGNISEQYGDQQSPTLGQMTGAAIETGGRGAMASTGFIGGAIAGTKAGVVMAPFAGPLAPAVPFVTGLAGAVGGAVLGDELAESMGLRAPSDLPQDLRPAGYFGESLFGSVPFMGLPYGLAASNYRAADTVAGRYLNTIIDTAKKRPVRFGVAEVSAATSAATAAGLAEQIAPGETGIRIGAEVAGGVLNPTRMAITSIDYATRTVSRVAQSLSASGRETAAGEMLSQMAALANEDPAILARILQEQTLIVDGKEIPLTSAQITGSEALIGLEKYLADVDPAFGAQSQQKAKEALDIIRGSIVTLRGTGDPTALEEAAKLQSAYFKTLIQARVDTAFNEAVTAASKITADTPEARAEINRQARDLITNAITESRKAETELWNAVDGTREVDFANLQTAYDEIVGDLLPEIVNEKTPKIVRDFLKRIGTPPEPEQTLLILPENIGRDVSVDIPGTNVSEMRQLRSELLDLARQSTNSGEYGQARIYNNLAEAVLDDLDAAFTESGDTAYQTARQFSKDFNETFTRSFVGKVTSSGRYGNRIMPELTLIKALATGKEAGAIQLQELEEATRFMVTQGFGDPSSVREMMTAQERIIRLAAAEGIDAKTGKINPKQLNKFIKDNPVLMNRFPEIRDDLQRAIKADDARLAMESLAKRQNLTMEKTKAFTNIAKVGQLTAADRMLISMNQEQDLMNMINVAKVGGRTIDGMQVTPQQATEGLRLSVLDAAMRRSTNRTTGEMNIGSFKGYLFESSVPGRKAPIEMMQENGVISSDEVNNIRKLIDAAERIQRSQAASGMGVDASEDAGDMVLSLVARLTGSMAAGVMTRTAGTGGNSIIIHGAAARFADNITKKLPVKARQQILIEAMNDPQKAALLLDKVGNPYEAAMRTRQINAWFIQSGIVTAKEIMAADEPEATMDQPGFLRQPRQ